MQRAGSPAFYATHHIVHRIHWRHVGMQINIIRPNIKFQYRYLFFLAHFLNQLPHSGIYYRLGQHGPAEGRAPDNMVTACMPDSVLTEPISHIVCVFHSTIVPNLSLKCNLFFFCLLSTRKNFLLYPIFSYLSNSPAKQTQSQFVPVFFTI